MLWLDTSWVLKLTGIQASSHMLVIFSTLTSFHHYFLTSHITTCYIHHLSFPSSLLTRYYQFFHLEWWSFTHCYMEDNHLFSIYFTSWVVVQRSYFEGLSCQWGFMLRQYMGRVCDCIFMGGHSLLIRVCAKKKKGILHYVILHWACVWTCQFASLSLCVRESSYGSLFLRFHLGNIFWMRVWVAYSIFVRGEWPFFL